MSPADSAARGRALLAERMAAAPAFVSAVPEIFDVLLERPARLPRCLVTTGIGTSEGHARHLAELAARLFGQPARFATTGSLATAPPPGAEQDWLVVFSQGLSANARHALRHVEAFAGVVLVTGLSLVGSRAEETSDEKRDWLVDLEHRGVVRIELGCGAEYGVLLRVIGARVGYAVAWSLLRTLARRRLESASGLAVAKDVLERVQHAAVQAAQRVIPAGERVSSFFAPERTLLLMGEGGVLELCDHLTLKLAEGMLRPQPRAVDVLQFAHGPLQSLAERPLSILYFTSELTSDLTPERAPGLAPGSGPRSPESDWLTRLRRTLDPARHDLRVVGTELPLPFACLELEAIFDSWILRHQDETGLDLVVWPGAEREGALYGASPPLAPPIFEARAAVAPHRVRASPVEPQPLVLESAVWPEIERALAAGHRAAIVPLGSIEQHGPHLPLATDRWIADALARALAERVAGAVALPAIPFGCASEHLDFAGTLHLAAETLEAILHDLLASLARHGFERAFVFTAHGGNVEALREMEGRLVQRARPLAVAIETGIDLGRLQSRIVAAAGLEPSSAGPHAGEYETSLVAWLRPGSVRAGALEAGPPVDPAAGQALFYPSLRPNAPRGLLGDPRRAARERGSSYLDAWVDALETAYHSADRRALADGPQKKRR